MELSKWHEGKRYSFEYVYSWTDRCRMAFQGDMLKDDLDHIYSGGKCIWR